MLKPRNSIEMAVAYVCAVAVIGIAVDGIWNVYRAAGGVAGGFCVAFIGIAAVGVSWARAAGARSRARVQLTEGEEHRRLTDEYRRLADMAITAQEHTDLKLGDVSVRIDHMREQMESLRKILNEVE
jgi:hypothetical protein